MARKTKTITIDNENSRDHGKSYQITEMAVLDIDEWAIRVGCAMARGGVNVKDLDLSGGIALGTVGGILDLVNLGIRGFGNMLPSEVVQLLNELVSRCVKVVTSSGTVRTLDINNASDVEEWRTTLWRLRTEAFQLHVDFFKQDES